MIHSSKNVIYVQSISAAQALHPRFGLNSNSCHQGASVWRCSWSNTLELWNCLVAPNQVLRTTANDLIWFRHGLPELQVLSHIYNSQRWRQAESGSRAARLYAKAMVPMHEVGVKLPCSSCLDTLTDVRATTAWSWENLPLAQQTTCVNQSMTLSTDLRLK